MHATPSNFFERILRSEALVCKSYFFSEQPFYGNYSTLDSHTITVISHAFAHSSRWRRKTWQGLLWYLIRSSTRTCMQWHAGTELRLSLVFEFIVIVIWKNGNCNLFTCKHLNVLMNSLKRVRSRSNWNLDWSVGFWGEGEIGVPVARSLGGRERTNKKSTQIWFRRRDLKLGPH